MSIQRTDELRFARYRQRTERDGVILHHEFRMQFAKTEKRTKEATLAKRIAFRVQKTDELRFARYRQRTERDGVILHHEFRMQFAETKKRTKKAALAKRTKSRI
ncbi:hypothetical protein [Leptospira borgpetersenii]|uniref:hypothetical protein n=1 Tax=Leptospira borgpetersenii TaxID=174 RepID=UPI000B2C6D9B|nr:hypothetical protein [Leptospira borgpetersenii]